MSSKQDEIKSLVEKINLLFRIFEKDGVNKISTLEKELLKEQAVKLVKAIDELETENERTIYSYKPAQNNGSAPIQNDIVETQPVQPKQETPIAEPVKMAPVAPKPVVEEKIEVPQPQKVEAPKAPVQSVTKPAPKPVRNLRQIIDLNKSFVFKKELFDNNQEAYTSFIDELNHLKDEEESLKLAAKMAEESGWDVEDKTYELLLNAIEKRFSPILG